MMNTQSFSSIESVPMVPFTSISFVAPTGQSEAPASMSEAFLICSHVLSLSVLDSISAVTLKVQVVAL